MEEQVGLFWHRLITSAATTTHKQAAIELDPIRQQAGILFRALGGDPGLRVENATATTHRARRRWLQRIAGTHRKLELAWRDDDTLRLPSRIALFPDARLNRDLYFWLTALATIPPPVEQDWLCASQQQVLGVFQRWPGMVRRYQRLLPAQLALRPDPRQLPKAEAAAEQAIRTALQYPGSVAVLPSATRPVQAVYLWLHPAPPSSIDRTTNHQASSETAASAKSQSKKKNRKKYRAERVDDPDGKTGLLAFRLESLFSWTEYVNVDRTSDDSEDSAAHNRADDLDVISIARSSETVASQLKLDLDLPPASQSEPLPTEGLPLPEWDYRRHRLLPDHCRLQLKLPNHATSCELPVHLHKTARRLRQQFQALTPERNWQSGQLDGNEIDIDACIRYISERRHGNITNAPRLYRELHSQQPELACLLLADLSLSTEAWVDDDGRVIDVIRDSLYLFSEALSASHSQFALYGFSSRQRSQVYAYPLKTFAETYTAAVRGRIAAIMPDHYTRMGAAIRYATSLLEEQSAAQRLLLLLSDGKPNDMDCYEGRYGIEDTRKAVQQARRSGLYPFCVTIDQEAEDYLPYLFGSTGFVVIRNPNQLPHRLVQLYACLTRSA